MNVELEALVAAVETVATKRQEGQAVNLRDDLRQIPVPFRVFVAAIVLAAADRPITGKNLATVGAFSRGSTLRDYPELVGSLRESAGDFVAVALDDASAGHSATQLSAELQQRDDTIAKLRAEVKQKDNDLNVVLSYARDLHERYRRELEEDEQERATKVRHLRPTDSTT